MDEFEPSDEYLELCEKRALIDGEGSPIFQSVPEDEELLADIESQGEENEPEPEPEELEVEPSESEED